jgi:hypothetical protein
LPSNHGYTIAFAVSAVSLVIAAAASILVPTPRALARREQGVVHQAA